jgi:ubiquinone/menaquinone biosynthesis C-methylase UbiE
VNESQRLKAESVKQWTQEPAGAVLAGALPRGTPDFFREVEQTRYALYPWLLPYLRHPRWSGRRVLEIGVGLGTDHLQLSRAGAIMHGVDLTPTSLEMTRLRFEQEGRTTTLALADAEDLPFEDESFDAVYSFGVLHHTPDMDAAIQEVRRILKPTGFALIAIYNRNSYFHGWRLLRHYASLEWRRKSLAEMRADFEFGEGVPVVHLTSRRDVQQLFRRFRTAQVAARHLPTNRGPQSIRPHLDALLRGIERRVGWYWVVEASP